MRIPRAKRTLGATRADQRRPSTPKPRAKQDRGSHKADRFRMPGPSHHVAEGTSPQKNVQVEVSGLDLQAREGPRV
jgi:hypothetical protein